MHVPFTACPAWPWTGGWTLGLWLPLQQEQDVPKTPFSSHFCRSLRNLKPNLGEEQGRFSWRMGVWSVETLREAEGKRNKGQAKVWDGDCLRTLGVASKNDMSPAPMDRRCYPAPGVRTVVGVMGGWSFVQEDPSSLTWCDRHLGPLPKSESVVPIATLWVRALQKGPGFVHSFMEDTHPSLEL